MPIGWNWSFVARQAPLVCAIAVTGCAIVPEALTENTLLKVAVIDRDAMFAGAPLPDRALRLEDAIARALKFNLDLRAKAMEEALAFDQTQLDRFDLLPKLAANAGYLSRSDNAASTSTDFVTGKPSLANPSFSLDRKRVVSDLTLSWSILDVGVGYFNAKQNADRTLIARQRRRKATLMIVQDVRTAYWRAVGAKMLRGKIRQTIADGNRALTDSRRVAREKLRARLDVLRFQKTLIENIRQLRIIDQELAIAEAELAALVNAPPGAVLRLAPVRDYRRGLPLNQPGMSIEKAEELAFIRNPDAIDSVYQARIAVADTHKAIFRMVPGISLTSARQFDGNSFLVSNTWTEASARIGVNLITSLLAAPAQMAYSEGKEKVVEARRLALRMALLAQVHIANTQTISTKSLFQNARELFDVDQGIADTVKVRQENNVQSLAEVIANKTVALTSEVRVFTTYAQYQAAIGRLLATTGMEIATESEILELSVDELGQRIGERLSGDHGRRS